MCSIDRRGTVDVTNRTTVATVVYGPMTIRNHYNERNDSALSLVDGCSSTFDEEIPGVNSSGYMVRSILAHVFFSRNFVIRSLVTVIFACPDPQYVLFVLLIGWLA